MSDLNRSRHRWSWRNCFAIVKYNRKSRKHSNHTANLQKSNSHVDHQSHRFLETVEEKTEDCQSSFVTPEQQADTETQSFLPLQDSNNENNAQYFLPQSCIIQVESPSTDNEKKLVAVDAIEQIVFEDIDGSTIIRSSSSALKLTHLDAIVEDSNEEYPDDQEETTQAQTVRLYCDREIVHDANDLHSRLFDLSHMNHVKTQFKENGNLLGEFTKQIDRLRMKSDDIIRSSTQIPRDAELLEARYSTLLSTIESLSVLLKVAQIPASRSLINRLVFTIEQRMEQLRKLIQLSSALSSQRRDLNDDDFLSFRSALSSYEHLFSSS